MKKFLPYFALATLVSSLSLCAVSCGTLQKEFSSPDGGKSPPPISNQLNAASALAAPIAGATPLGSLVIVAMNLAAAGAAAFATFRARAAATTHAATVDKLTALLPTALSPPSAN
jgi:hypothetical protein